MTDLAHPNWRELTTFVRELNEALMTPNGKFKPEFVHIDVGLQEAIMQFWAETSELVEGDNGIATRYGFGISGMTPKEWFNNDLPLRQKWAKIIENTYRRYQASVTESETSKNDIQAELAKLREEVYKLTESMNMQKMAPNNADEKQMVMDDPAKDKATKAAEADKAGAGMSQDNEEEEKKAGIDDDEEAEGEA